MLTANTHSIRRTGEKKRMFKRCNRIGFVMLRFKKKQSSHSPSAPFPGGPPGAGLSLQ